ncbi:MAG: alpha,alpha-trehalose-phosphate synthase (UDP-forming) [Leucobacter sp.]
MSEILIVANRLPVTWKVSPEGIRSLAVSPSGLVSALNPVYERLGCTWVGWLEDASHEVLTVDGLRLVAVDAGRELYEQYYHGFANQVLWPMFHGLPAFASHPNIETNLDSWFSAYRAVNQAFAERIAAVAAEASFIWVQDYHLLLLPMMLRELRPDLHIRVFLHIPFAFQELGASHQWAPELLTGLGAADLIGVQTERDAHELRQAIAAGISPHSPTIRAFPISIDTSLMLRDANTAQANGAVPLVRERFGAARSHMKQQNTQRQLMLGVDRLDYTKGILERVTAFAALLDSWDPETAPPVLVQVLSPTREDIPAYQEYAQRVAAAIDAVNERFETQNYTPVITLTAPLPASELAALFLAADVMCVTSLRDGMNLVAKEFVISRVDEGGVLLLSLEAGAADELLEAVLVDPNSQTDLVAGMRRALLLSDTEATRRMRILRSRVLEHDVYAWAESFIETEAAPQLWTETSVPASGIQHNK